jgi:hypothetical protein
LIDPIPEVQSLPDCIPLSFTMLSPFSCVLTTKADCPASLTTSVPLS